MQSDVELNREGKLTKAQRIYLIGEFLQRLAFIFIWLLFVFIIENTLKKGNVDTRSIYILIITLLKSAGIVALLSYTSLYVLDLFWAKPINARGVLSKYRKRVGRSDQHWLAAGSHKILTTKTVWLSLQAGVSHELFYGKWTKQLLSYEQLSSNN